MKKSWKRGGRTYDTDRYESLYHFCDDRFYKSVWPESPLVGPEGYNRSNIDLMLDNRKNRVDVIKSPSNPFFEARSRLSSERAKFEP